MAVLFQHEKFCTYSIHLVCPGSEGAGCSDSGHVYDFRDKSDFARIECRDCGYPFFRNALILERAWKLYMREVKKFLMESCVNKIPA